MKQKHTRVLPYRTPIRIESYDVNEKSKLSLPGIAAIFQEAAWKHASELNYGYHSLKERDLHWVLKKTNIKINRFPDWTEAMCLRTWPSDIEKLFFIRDFDFYDVDRKLSVFGSSSWLIVNKNGRPQIPSHIHDEIPLYIDEKRIKAKTAFPDDASNYKKCFDKKIRQSDIDVHHHVNNVRYYEWVVDCLGENNISETKIREIEMNFIAECRINDLLTIYQGSKNGIHFVKGKIEHKEIFLSKIKTR